MKPTGPGRSKPWGSLRFVTVLREGAIYQAILPLRRAWVPTLPTHTSHRLQLLASDWLAVMVVLGKRSSNCSVVGINFVSTPRASLETLSAGSQTPLSLSKNFQVCITFIAFILFHTLTQWEKIILKICTGGMRSRISSARGNVLQREVRSNIFISRKVKGTEPAGPDSTPAHTHRCLWTHANAYWSH